MTPEERQMLTGLADRIKSAPTQQRDEEAAVLIRDLVQVRPDTAYILAQTTLMQDFALRTAQAQIADLQRQLAEARPAPAASGGSFLGGLFGGGASVPAAGTGGPWVRPQTAYTQPAYAQPAYAAPVLQPSQTSGFLQNAAQTAVGIAGGMLLFQGMESLFSGHSGGFGGYGGGPWGGGGFGGGGYGPTENITETVVNNNYYDTPGGGQPQSDFAQDPADLQDNSGYTDTGFDDGGGDFGGSDDQSI